MIFGTDVIQLVNYVKDAKKKGVNYATLFLIQDPVWDIYILKQVWLSKDASMIQQNTYDVQSMLTIKIIINKSKIIWVYMST